LFPFFVKRAHKKQNKKEKKRNAYEPILILEVKEDKIELQVFVSSANVLIFIIA